MQVQVSDIAKAIQDSNILGFAPEGEPFTLKDGSKSFFFYNVGNCASPVERLVLARAIVGRLLAFGVDNFDAIYGPAYKGIGLAFDVSMILYLEHSVIKPVVYNRKEAKDHGEGGVLVGADPAPGLRLVVLDDVLTGGKAKRESADIINEYGMSLVLVVVIIKRAAQGVAEDLAEELDAEVVWVVTHEELKPFFSNIPAYVDK